MKSACTINKQKDTYLDTLKKLIIKKYVANLQMEYLYACYVVSLGKSSLKMAYIVAI